MGELVRCAVLLAFASPEFAAGAGLVAGAGSGGEIVLDIRLRVGEHTGGDGSEDEEEVGLHCDLEWMGRRLCMIIGYGVITTCSWWFACSLDWS